MAQPNQSKMRWVRIIGSNNSLETTDVVVVPGGLLFRDIVRDLDGSSTAVSTTFVPSGDPEGWMIQNNQ